MRLNSMNTYMPDATALTKWNITTTTGVAPYRYLCFCIYPVFLQ